MCTKTGVFRVLLLLFKLFSSSTVRRLILDSRVDLYKPYEVRVPAKVSPAHVVEIRTDEIDFRIPNKVHELHPYLE